MRIFSDRHGRRWQAAVGKQSYGVRLLLFTPMRGSGVHQVLLDSRNSLDANAELAELSEAQLCDQLARAVPWDGSG